MKITRELSIVLFIGLAGIGGPEVGRDGSEFRTLDCPDAITTIANGINSRGDIVG